jgi:cellulose synthase/poly-beta-1,6-N-acetylglucosamine synthase-like glycosyltransferase
MDDLKSDLKTTQKMIENMLARARERLHEKKPPLKKYPHITVVVPAYNEEEYLPKCLEAIKAQNYPKDKFDIVVANNNSKDNTASIAEKAGATVIKETKQGHVFALNSGMHAAKGEIIAVTDADTLVSPDWLDVIARVFEDKEVVGVTGSAYYNSGSKMNEYFGKISYSMFVRFHFALNKPHFSGLNLAVRKSAFMEIKGLDTRYETFGDIELGLRIKSVGKVLFCEDMLVASSPRRWEKGTLEDYYKYLNSYFNTMWLKRPPKSVLTPRR